MVLLYPGHHADALADCQISDIYHRIDACQHDCTDTLTDDSIPELPERVPCRG